jgi:hypothetical protein
MLQRPVRLIALACTAVLAAALVAGPGGAAVPRATQQGVTKDAVNVVVLIADLDGLRARGVQLPASLTTANLTKRWVAFFDALGPVNGRKITVTPVTWDPADPTSFDKTCVKATQDNKPFAVLNATGYRASSVGCITVDHNTFMFYGDSAYAALIAAAKKNLVTLGLPAEVSASTAANLIVKQKLIDKATGKVGILSGNEPAFKAAGDTAEASLKKAGYTIASKTEINVTGQDVGGQQRDAAAAVAPMKAAGVSTVIVTIPFTINVNFFNEAKAQAAGFKYVAVDYGGSLCSQFGAASVPASAAEAQMPCVTIFDTRAVPAKNAIKKDNAFEAKCRATFDAAYGVKSIPGVPAGGVTDASGTALAEDVPPNECLMASLFHDALKGAGKNPTTAKLYDAFLKINKAPAAYMSNGEGGFGKNKNYFATQVHLETVQAAARTTPKDANGLYNGCPAPAPCFVPTLINGQEWFAVATG